MLATTCKTPPLRLAQLFTLRVAGRQTAHSPRVRSTNSCNKGLIVRAGSMLLRSQRSDMIPNSDRVMTLREELLQLIKGGVARIALSSAETRSGR